MLLLQAIYDGLKTATAVCASARGDGYRVSVARTDTSLAQGDHTSPYFHSSLWQHAVSCILVIFSLLALITFSCCLLCLGGLLGKEIKGGYNYEWGKLKHCLLEANWILPQTAGQFISPPDTGVMSTVAARAIKTLCSCLQNTTVFFFSFLQPEPLCSKQMWRLCNEGLVQFLTEVGWLKRQEAWSALHLQWTVLVSLDD